jgi:hypothetical protein
MNISAKLALTFVAVTTLGIAIEPMVASAAPVTGSTAAAVTIEFQDPGTTSGSFSLNPDGTATSNVNGVKAISAAIATGETKATATSGSTGSGITATSEGFSQPVTFKFNTSNNTTTGAGNTTVTGTNYDYTGSTTGMSFIPAAQ